MEGDVSYNKEKDILILVGGPTQGIDGTTLTAKKCIKLILLWLKRNIASGCIIMKQIVIYLLMVQKFIKLSNRFWDCGNYANYVAIVSIMLRKHFKKTVQ